MILLINPFMYTVLVKQQITAIELMKWKSKTKSKWEQKNKSCMKGLRTHLTFGNHSLYGKHLYGALYVS